jgi:hypothetical protein
LKLILSVLGGWTGSRERGGTDETVEDFVTLWTRLAKFVTKRLLCVVVQDPPILGWSFDSDILDPLVNYFVQRQYRGSITLQTVNTSTLQLSRLLNLFLLLTNIFKPLS